MYKAIIAKAHTHPHPNADRLQLATVLGHQVVVGLDVRDGQVGAFFPSDGQLSAEMCDANDLIGYTDPETGEKKGGYFPKTRRVRAQKFRGEKSDGYWTPLAALAWTGAILSDLEEGFEFETLNGKLVCNKYYTPATLRAQHDDKPDKPRRRQVLFPQHVDTKQFRYYSRTLPEGAVVYITEKLHGTSGRYGHVPVTTKRPWWQRLLGEAKREWAHLTGSRRVVLLDESEHGYYHTNSFRYDVIQGLTLHKGEIIYYEIVGDVTLGHPIMHPQPIKDDLRDLRTHYGDTMRYRYGCADGEHRMYVYRITHVNEDGVEIDLSWPQVEQRARELGLHIVPVLYCFLNTEATDSAELVAMMTEGPSTIDSTHIREGVCVRVESSEGIQFLKHKSWAFGVLEGYIKDSDSYVDMEEVG